MMPETLNLSGEDHMFSTYMRIVPVGKHVSFCVVIMAGRIEHITTSSFCLHDMNH